MFLTVTPVCLCGRFVLGLIQKDRQLESLVEKLCHRLRAAPEPRQWRDLAFCLSLINFRSDAHTRESSPHRTVHKRAMCHFYRQVNFIFVI